MKQKKAANSHIYEPENISLVPLMFCGLTNGFRALHVIARGRRTVDPIQPRHEITEHNSERSRAPGLCLSTAERLRPNTLQYRESEI